MKFYDLNISNTFLAEKERQLGFDKVVSLPVIEGDERKVVGECKKKKRGFFFFFFYYIKQKKQYI